MPGNLRETDTLGRLGGEEFAVLLPETDVEGGLVVAETLRHAVETASVSTEAGENFRLTISVGVTVCSGADPDIDALLKKADIALYEAKKKGRNRVCVAAGKYRQRKTVAAVKAT